MKWLILEALTYKFIHIEIGRLESLSATYESWLFLGKRETVARNQQRQEVARGSGKRVSKGHVIATCYCH